MGRIKVLPEDFAVDGKKVKFVHDDGSFAEHTVGSCGTDRDGSLMFWELLGMLDNGVLNGKNKYKRLIIKRVFPVIEGE